MIEFRLRRPAAVVAVATFGFALERWLQANCATAYWRLLRLDLLSARLQYMRCLDQAADATLNHVQTARFDWKLICKRRL